MLKNMNLNYVSNLQIYVSVLIKKKYCYIKSGEELTDISVCIW